jgi:hypothetical protein
MTRATSPDSVDQYRNELFGEERLSNRSRIFFNHTLPLLDRARGNHQLLHVVSYSAELPRKYRRLLKDAAKSYKWLVLDKRTRTNRKGTSLNTFVKRYFEPGSIYGSYRLDDDDVLAPTYFDQVASYLERPFANMVVSLGLGVQAFFHEGEFVNPRMEHRPKIAIGLMKICEYTYDGRFLAPQNIAHTRTDLVNAMILDSRQVSFLHSMHLTQDTHIDKPSGDFEKRLRNHMRLPEVAPETDLASVFPGVKFVTDDKFKPVK